MYWFLSLSILDTRIGFLPLSASVSEISTHVPPLYCCNLRILLISSLFGVVIVSELFTSETGELNVTSHCSGDCGVTSNVGTRSLLGTTKSKPSVFTMFLSLSVLAAQSPTLDIEILCVPGFR